MIKVPFFNLLVFNLIVIFLLGVAYKSVNFAMKVTKDALCPNESVYEEGARISLFANTIRSPNDPCYVRPYFELPFCPPYSPRVKHKRKKSLEEILLGDCFNETRYDFIFKKDVLGRVLCEKELSKVEVAKFRDAIERESLVDVFLNNIRLQHKVGTMKKVDLDTGTIYSRPKFYLYNHVNFFPYHYKNKVAHLAALSAIDSAADITEDAAVKVKFTYSVLWKGLDNSQDSYETMTRDWCSIDWRTVVYSAAIISSWVWLLLYAIVRPYVRRYFNEPSHDVENSRNVVTSLHNGALANPPYSSLFAAFRAVGIQLFVTICALFALVNAGILRPCNVDILYEYLLGIYSLTSLVSGYEATSFNSQYNRHGQKECILHTGVLYLVPVFLTVFSFTMMAKVAIESPILPQVVEVINFVIWGSCTIFFLILGGIIGHYSFKYFNSESRELDVSTNTIASASPNASTSTSANIRASPSARSKRSAEASTRASTSTNTRTSRNRNQIEPKHSRLISTTVQMFLGGFLPFLVILYRMDEIYASLWNLKVCHAFNLLLRSFIMVSVVTIMVGMAFTFYQMHLKDYNWWWRSILRGGSTALYMFVYGIFFQARTKVDDLSYLLIFLCFNACISYSFFLVLATLSYYAGFYAQDIYHCKTTDTYRQD